MLTAYGFWCINCVLILKMSSSSLMDGIWSLNYSNFLSYLCFNIVIFCLQGSFSLCRVVKKTEQGLKIGEFQGESKAKSIVSSIKKSFTPRMFKSKALRSSEESPSQASYTFDESTDSTPITSPSKIHSTMEPEPSLTQFDYTSVWMTHEMVSDASKVYHHKRLFSSAVYTWVELEIPSTNSLIWIS